jgi:DNA-binding transcriptional LysR family regulator
VQVNFSGRRLARSARLAIGELQAGFAELGVGTEGNTIAIGTTPLARAFLVPEAMATMVPDPEQTVGGFQVLEGNWGDLVELLRDGLIHLIVGELPQHDSPDLAKQPLHQESLLIVAGRQHPLAGKLAPHLDALASYPWIVSPPGSPLRAEWERLFDGRPLPAAPIECGSIMIVGRLLTSSDLLALTTPDQVALQIRSGLLARVGPALGDRRHAIGITMRRGWRPTGQQQRFIEALARVSSGMTAHGGNAGRVARSWNRRP